MIIIYSNNIVALFPNYAGQYISLDINNLPLVVTYYADYDYWVAVNDIENNALPYLVYLLNESRNLALPCATVGFYENPLFIDTRSITNGVYDVYWISAHYVDQTDGGELGCILPTTTVYFDVEFYIFDCIPNHSYDETIGECVLEEPEPEPEPEPESENDIIEYCGIHPDASICNAFPESAGDGITEFCVLNPTASICNEFPESAGDGITEFCVLNPTVSICNEFPVGGPAGNDIIEFCLINPDAAICADVSAGTNDIEDFCLDNPTALMCQQVDDDGIAAIELPDIIPEGEAGKTFGVILSDFMVRVSQSDVYLALAALEIPDNLGVCPVMEFVIPLDIFNHENFIMDMHCFLFEQFRAQIAVLFLFVFSAGGLFLILDSIT